MRIRTRRLVLTCLLLLSFVSVLNAADDTRFTLKDGVIYDSELGLQWVPAPDREMNYYQAEEYVRKLSLAGGGWRLPTRWELANLYNRSSPGGADPKFNVSERWVWTSELDGPYLAWFFNFGYGTAGRGYRDSSYYYTPGVLAVRSRR